jgi:hypothetical protein
LKVLAAFVVAVQPFQRPEDADAARRLTHKLIGRVLSEAPDHLHDLAAICRLCWQIDRRATFMTTLRRLSETLVAGWRTAKKG